jgi:hypothetical protein
MGNGLCFYSYLCFWHFLIVSGVFLKNSSARIVCISSSLRLVLFLSTTLSSSFLMALFHSSLVFWFHDPGNEFTPWVMRKTYAMGGLGKYDRNPMEKKALLLFVFWWLAR